MREQVVAAFWSAFQVFFEDDFLRSPQHQTMSSLFNPDRSLLNPKFEGYKLDPLEQEGHVHTYPLPGDGATQSTVSSRLGSFKEVQSRIAFNHIAPGYWPNQAGYVDKCGNFVIVTYDSVSKVR